MPPAPATLRAAAGVALLAAVGSLLLAIAHTGVEVPVLSELGPRGDAVPPAVVAFAIGTAVFGAVGVGLLRVSRPAWIAGIVVGVLGLLGGIGQFRGVASAIGLVLCAALVALLLAPASRRASRRA